MKKNKYFIEEINFHDGLVTYNDFDINEDLSFENQKYSYKEDIFQVTFGDRFILDVGWHPEFDPKGYFLTQVIQSYDWINPSFKHKSKNLEELKKSIEDAILYINKMRNIDGGSITDKPNMIPKRKR